MINKIRHYRTPLYKKHKEQPDDRKRSGCSLYTYHSDSIVNVLRRVPVLSSNILLFQILPTALSQSFFERTQGAEIQ